jgi:hypothetical protein
MKKIFLVLIAGLLLSCSTTSHSIKNDPSFAGKITDVDYLKKIDVTYVQTTKTEVQLVGKVKAKKGRKCYFIRKSDGKNYLLIEKMGEYLINTK